MDKAVTLIKIPIQNEMDMRIHQTESQDDDPVFPGHNIDTVHPLYKVIVVHKNNIDGIAVCTEMPAVSGFYFLSPDKWDLESEVRLDLPKQLIINRHLISRATSGCLVCKIRRIIHFAKPENHRARRSGLEPPGRLIPVPGEEKSPHRARQCALYGDEMHFCVPGEFRVAGKRPPSEGGGVPQARHPGPRLVPQDGLAIDDVDGDGAVLVDAALEDLAGQLVDQFALDQSFDRAGAVDRIVPVLDHVVLERLRVL